MTSSASLSGLKAELDACRRCPLYKRATQGVPGEGPRRARLMLVGEQPGNDEDLAGKPFVGPAGKMLDRVLDEAGVDRAAVFVTNAVKHFKFEQRGRRRLHKRPNAHEIERCRWWLDKERALVKPALTVALGATAARSLIGKTVTIAKLRGKVLDLPDGTQGLVTIHPSLLLRIPDGRGRATGFKQLTRDLRDAWRFASGA
jgi:uracil-DNA glycosylase family protein